MAMTVIAMLSLPSGSHAQESTTSNTRWSGENVDNLTSDTEFYLYNVGTGKFVTQGGEWGIQAMLLYQDFGTAMKTEKVTVDGTELQVIYSGAQNSASITARCFGANYPGYTNSGTFGDGRNCAGVIFEGDYSGTRSGAGYTRSWNFTRVETDGESTYTYYLTERLTYGSSSTTVYVGSQNGIDPDDTANNTSVADTNVKDIVCYSVNSGHQSVDSLNYQWRFVTKAQLEAALNNESAEAYGGLNYNINYLINDPYLDRNRNDEFALWTVTSQSTGSTDIANHSQDDNYFRYDWYWNDVDRANDSEYQSYVNIDNASGPKYSATDGRIFFDAPWDKARFRKPTFDTFENGSYSYGLFEGIGTVSQTFTAPVEGWYEVEVRGLYQGNEAKLYISDGTDTQEVSLVNASGFVKTTTSGITSADNNGLLAIGKALSANENGQYTVSVNIYVETAGTQITFGISKQVATQAKGEGFTAGRNFYYDADIVAVDNFNLHYLGKKSPFVLDEEATSADYMTNADFTNVPVYLYRTFTLNQWNSLVLPINMTTAQVRQAFGDGVQLAKLDGVGTLTDGISSIDFKTVQLPADGTAISAGELYIVKPTVRGSNTVRYLADPSVTSGTVMQKSNCYSLGRRDMDGSQLVQPQGATGQSVAEGIPGVHYQGTYISLTADDAAAPQAKSYVFSGGRMYHITKAFAIKGFRGWLTDIAGVEAKTFSIDSPGTPTAIDGIINDATSRTDEHIYNVSGQYVGSGRDRLQSLPAGIYIVGGKKMIVK